MIKIQAEMNRKYLTFNNIYLYVFLLSLLFVLPASASSKLDSLAKELLVYQTRDTFRVRTLERITYLERFRNPDKAILYAKEGLFISDSLHYAFGQIYCMNHIGTCFLMKGQYKLALQEYLKVVKKFGTTSDPQVSKGLSLAINNIGMTYFEMNELTLAEKFFNKALVIDKKLNNRKGISRELGNLGKVKLNKDELDSSLHFLEAAVAIDRSMGENIGEIESLVDVALVYYKKGEYYHSKEILLELRKRDLKDCVTATIWIDQLLGKISYQQRVFKEAIVYQKRALKNANKMEELSLSISSLKELAELYRSMGEYSKALSYIDTFNTASAEMAKHNHQARSADILGLLEVEKEGRSQSDFKMNHDDMVYYNSRLISMRNGLVLSLCFSLILGAIIYKAYRDKRRVNRELMQKFKEVRSKNNEIAAKSFQIEAINATLLDINSSLHKNEFQLKEAQRIAGLGSWEFRMDEKTFTCSEYLSKLFFKEEHESSTFSLRLFLSSISEGDRKDVFVSLRRAIMDGKEEDVAFTVVSRNGELRYLQARAVPLHDANGNVFVIAGTVLDTSAQKKIEIGLKEAKEHAEMANHSKSVFLANMSHEIRTPLNGIIGFTDIMLKDASGVQLEYLNHIRKSGDNLLVILNDILDFNKIEVGKLAIEEFNFSLLEMVKEACAPYLLQAREKGLLLNVIYSPEIPKFVVGDPHRTRQVLINFISNAIKFTKSGSIVIAVSVDEMSIPDGNDITLKFIISDSGIGVPKDKQDSIFDVFTQADNSTTRKYGGTGLGLAINAQLAKLMGGTTGINSPGVLASFNCPGSDFWFTTKVKRGKDNLQEDTNTTKRDSFVFQRRVKVLVAEDNLINQILIRKVLEAMNCDVTLVENGKLAVDLVMQESFDAILMDIQMPVMDGHQATIIIRQKMNNLTPIIGVSANVFKEDINKSLFVGMNDHIGKPFTSKDLYMVLSKFVFESKNENKFI